MTGGFFSVFEEDNDGWFWIFFDWPSFVIDKGRAAFRFIRLLLA